MAPNTPTDSFKLFLYYTKYQDQTIRKLGAKEDFSSLAYWLHTLHGLSHVKGDMSNIVKLPPYVVLVLAMNDFLSRQDGVLGRLMHPWRVIDQDTQPIVYAQRAWTAGERELYKALKPLDRLRVSAAWSRWHWNKTYTQVLKVRVVMGETVLPSEGQPPTNIIRFEFKLCKDDMRGIVEGDQAPIIFLLWTGKILLYTRLTDLFPPSPSIETTKNFDGKGLGHREGGPWIAANEEEGLAIAKADSAEKYCHNCLSTAAGLYSSGTDFKGHLCFPCRTFFLTRGSMKPTPKYQTFAFNLSLRTQSCQRWAQQRKVVTSNTTPLEQALHAKLSADAESEFAGGEKTTVDWKVAARAMFVGS